jgi:hypothetical protein
MPTRSFLMNVTQRSFISGTIVSGFIAFGWCLAIVLTFATESKPPGSLFVRAEPWSYYAALGSCVAIGICAAVWSFRQPRPSAVTWGAFSVAVFSLLLVAFLYLR